MAELQTRFDSGIPETQAEFMWWLGDGYPSALGPVRSQRMIPLHTYLDRGMIWAGCSPFGMSQAVDIHAALRSYTIWAARQLFMEKETGSLEQGKSADLAVWDRDPYTVPAEQLKAMVCEMTLFQGKVVYERPAMH